MFEKHINEILKGSVGKISILLKDLGKNGVEYSLNTCEKLPSASTIKVLIMIEALNQYFKGYYDLNEFIDVHHKDKVDFSVISQMKTNRYKYIDLITLMIIYSDNTATNVLIDLLGFDNINSWCEKMKLSNTVLKRKMMHFDEISEGKENYTSAEDLCVMLEKIYKREILNVKCCDIMIDILKRQQYNNLLKRYIPEEICVAHKTGENYNLRHDAGIFYLDNKTYILVVMMKDFEDERKAEETIGNISKLIYKKYTK